MLYFIPTPIWNKEDITLRALRLLKELKVILAEDTRTTRKLLSMYEISTSDKQLLAFTSFTDGGKMQHYLNLLQGQDVALVSEAGTPGLSDPGKSMIQLCNENNIPFTILPGANALVPAIVGAGFDTTEFTFLGFFPAKKWRQTLIKKILASEYPTFFYESVHRIEKTLEDFKALWFVGKVSICREASKMFEQFVTWTLDEVLDMIAKKKLPIKGEFVVGIKND